MRIKLLWCRTLPMTPNILQRDDGQFGHFGVDLRRIKQKARRQQHCQYLDNALSHIEEELLGTRRVDGSRMTDDFADEPAAAFC